MRWLLRMSQWARHPPSESRVLLGLGAILLCLAVAGAEWLGLLPDWFALNPRPPRPPSP